jgi:hypothetical protein
MVNRGRLKSCLLERLASAFPRLRHIWADMGYRGHVSSAARMDGGDRQAPVEVGAPPH